MRSFSEEVGYGRDYSFITYRSNIYHDGLSGHQWNNLQEKKEKVTMNKDEMIKDMETAIGKALGLTYDGERLPFSFHTRNYLAKELVKAGYRKIADDEQIVKTKQLYETLNSAQESGKRMGYAQGRDETVREILHKTKDYIENSVGGYLLIDRKGIRELATELGIELE